MALGRSSRGRTSSLIESSLRDSLVQIVHCTSPDGWSLSPGEGGLSVGFDFGIVSPNCQSWHSDRQELPMWRPTRAGVYTAVLAHAHIKEAPSRPTEPVPRSPQDPFDDFFFGPEVCHLLFQPRPTSQVS